MGRVQSQARLCGLTELAPCSIYCRLKFSLMDTRKSMMMTQFQQECLAGFAEPCCVFSQRKHVTAETFGCRKMYKVWTSSQWVKWVDWWLTYILRGMSPSQCSGSTGAHVMVIELCFLTSPLTTACLLCIRSCRSLFLVRTVNKDSS